MKLRLARLLIGLVLFFNVQCALAFLIWPQAYAPAFELTGTPGAAMIQGLGVLFLMWNIPYAVALSHPARRMVSLVEAAAMQATGFVGETILYLQLPGSHPLLETSVLRFMLFDGAGLLALLAALWLARRQSAHLTG